MIVKEKIEKGKTTLLHTYSDENRYIIRDKNIYEEALDPVDTDRKYKEGDPIDDPSKSGLTPDDAWKIIESSNISKENKALLKDLIYKEG